jgi:O-acetylhomoserine/O-acetylserine sulfhydrylase-like pyridoxal-dependent enzyme
MAILMGVAATAGAVWAQTTTGVANTTASNWRALKEEPNIYLSLRMTSAAGKISAQSATYLEKHEAIKALNYPTLRYIVNSLLSKYLKV